jgi:hypothetical protein
MDNSDLNARRSLRSLLRPLFITAVLVLIFNRFWNHSIIFRDSFHLFGPLKLMVAHGLKNGEVYGWNPWMFTGMPSVADILAGWFYPLNAVYLILPFEPAHRLFILIHYPMAAIFMDMFLRGRGIQRDLSLLGALAFPLCGYMISRHGGVPFLIGPAWAPLALYFIDRSLREGLRWALWAGAVPAVQVLAGDPQSAGITAALMAVVSLAGAFARGRLSMSAGVVAVAGIASIALAAVQILPTFELMSLSVRSGGLDLGESSLLSFHPGRLVELIWRTPFGLPWPQYSFWGEFALDESMPNILVTWSVTNYLGLPILVLALAGALFSRRKWRIVAAGGAVLFLLLALGRHTPLFSAFHALVPYFDRFRFPEKYMAWFSGFTVAAAVLGMEAVLEKAEGRSSLILKAGIAYTLFIAVCAVVSGYFLLESMRELSPFIENSPPFQAARSNLTTGGIQFFIVNAAIGSTLIFAALRRKALGGLIPVVTVIIVLDLVAANVSTMPTGPTDIYDLRSPVAGAIHHMEVNSPDRFRIFRRNVSFPRPNQWQLETSRKWDRMTLRRNLHLFEGFEEITGYSAVKIKYGMRLLNQDLSPGVLEIFNVKYVISAPDQPMRGLRSRLAFSDPKNNVVLYRLEDYWPRTYVVPGAKRAADEREAVELIRTTDLRKYVIITSDQDMLMDQGNGTYRPADVSVYQPDRVVINTRGEKPGWLVLSDRFYPGWEARVDGRPTEIYRANVIARAVKLGPGNHIVEFDFRPLSIRTGGAVSAVAWMAFICGEAVLWRSRQKKRRLTK